MITNLDDFKKIILTREALIGTIVITSLITLAILIKQLQSWWNKKYIPQYVVMKYRHDFEVIATAETGNNDLLRKRLFLNEGDLKQVEINILQQLDRKVEQNNSKDKSTVETNYLIGGAPGNGKTSLVRGIASHLKLKHKQDVVILNINTESLARVDGKIFTITSETKLRNMIREARKIAGSKKYVILNIEEMDYILDNHNISKVLLDELSNTDNTINHHLIFIGTTNDPDKIHKIREDQDKKPEMSFLGMQFPIPQASGNDRNPRQNRNPKIDQHKAGSIARRLKLIEIHTPDHKTIMRILQDGIELNDMDRKEGLINQLIHILDGSHAHCITSSVLTSIKYDLASNKSDEEIIENVKEIVNSEKKQTGIELTKTLIHKSLIDTFEREESFTPIDRADLEIDELKDYFKDSKNLEKLLTIFLNKLKDLQAKLYDKMSELNTVNINLHALQGNRYYGLSKMKNDLEKSLVEKGEQSAIAALNNDDIKNQINKIAKTETEILKLERQAATLKKEELALNKKVNAVNRMVNNLSELVESVKKYEVEHNKEISLERVSDSSIEF
jgi:hypothetical protein